MALILTIMCLDTASFSEEAAFIFPYKDSSKPCYGQVWNEGKTLKEGISSIDLGDKHQDFISLELANLETL